MLHNSWAALFVRAADRILPSRMMETCNVIQHVWGEFLVSRGGTTTTTILGRAARREIRKYIKFYCLLLSRNAKPKKSREEEERWMRKPGALLVHPKIYFMPVVVVEYFGGFLLICIQRNYKLKAGQEEARCARQQIVERPNKTEFSSRLRLRILLVLNSVVWI